MTRSPTRPRDLLSAGVLLVLAAVVSAAQGATEPTVGQASPPPLRNALADHPSPYLALHGRDPVRWQSWGREVMARARGEDRLLFVSVGYFACHWCHVMQRESYSDPRVAERLNRYLPVKVDRELNPALDARLIDFVERTRGRAGWPLNVVLTPDGYPLYGFTYLPRAQFLEVLARLSALWAQDPDEMRALAARAAAEMAAKLPGAERKPVTAALARELEQGLVAMALRHGDDLLGGFGDASKFPMTPEISTLLTVLEEGRGGTRQVPLRAFVVLTLEQMAQQGLRDHVGGGFFRYTTDPAWQRPHFEKMLYDNALLARLYLRAARVFDRDDFRAVGRETLDFMIRELRTPQGGFIASLSAIDDQDIEGGAYLWHPDQLGALLTADEAAVARLAYGMDGSPLTEDGYLPTAARTAREVAAILDRSEAQVRSRLASARSKLFRARAQRGLPRDTKELAGWNGLVLAALAEAVGRSDPQPYVQAAEALQDYLTGVLWRNGRLHRSMHGGEPVGTASLQDYAYVAWGLSDWSRRTADPERAAQARRAARQIARQAWTAYYNDRGWRLVEANVLPAAPPEPVIADGPVPSPAGVLIAVSARLDDPWLRNRAAEATALGHATLAESPLWFASHVRALTAARLEARNQPDG